MSNLEAILMLLACVACLCEYGRVSWQVYRLRERVRILEDRLHSATGKVSA